MPSENPVEKPFLLWGFDIEISVEDTFELTHLGGILFLIVNKKNGTEITARRQFIDELNGTSPLDLRSMTISQKEDLISRLLKLDTSAASICRLLGISPSSVSLVKKKMNL